MLLLLSLEIKVFKKLHGQQELGNYSQITNNVIEEEITLKSPTTILKIPKSSLEQPFLMEIRKRVMQIIQRFKTKVFMDFTT